MTQQQPRVRWRKALLVLTIALVASGAGALELAPGHYKLEWLKIVAAVCLVSAVLLANVLSVTASKIPRELAIAGVAVSALVALVALHAMVLARVIAMEGPRKVRNVVTSPDGRYELVVEAYSVMIDPAWDVWLRETEGLFARKVLVWTSIEDAVPDRVAFVGSNEIEVASPPNEVCRSKFDPATLEPYKVHCLGNWCPK